MKVKKTKGKKPTYKKIEAKPLTESQIVEFAAHYKKHGTFPGSKIPCTVTGKLTTCIGPWLKKKIKEFKSPENLLRNYKCRGALKNERQIIKPMSTKTKRKNKTNELKDEQKNWDIPKMNFAPPRPLNNSEITQTTESQCLRPDIFLSNGRHCEGCEVYDLCVNRLKCLPAWNKAAKKPKK